MNKTVKVARCLHGIIASAVVLLAFSGCETESVDSVKISPSSASLARGGSITLVGSGGSGSYQWALSNYSVGRLSASSGASVVYTATRTDDDQVVSILNGSGAIVAQANIAQRKVTSSEGSAGGNTNNLVEGKLHWVIEPPEDIELGKSFTAAVAGASDVANLKWHIGQGIRIDTNGQEVAKTLLQFVGSHEGRDQVTVKAQERGSSATLQVEDSRASGQKSSLSKTISIH